MEAKTLNFDQKPGDFIQAFRAYKQYKREWQARTEAKLEKLEEEIRRKREVLYAEYE